MNIKYIYVLLFISLLFIGQASAGTTVDFNVQYQDSITLWHSYTDENLVKYPMYVVIDNGDTYTIMRFGESVTLPKRTWLTYQFLPDRIIPVATINSYAQIDSLVTKVDLSTLWYLTFPWSASQVKSVTDDLIDMGVFKRTTKIDVKDSNNSSYIVVPKVVGNDIRLYFNPTTYAGVVYPLILTEQTITVTNATTAGWTAANVSLNGSAWSGKNGGSLRANLKNDSALNMSGLVAAWYFDSESGTLAQNVNTESGLINTTNQGTLVNMNTGLNNCTGNCSGWNSSGVIGNALAFDGVDDYVDVGNNASLNLTTAGTMGVWINPKVYDAVERGIITKGGITTGYLLWYYGTGNIYIIEFADNLNNRHYVGFSNSLVPINKWSYIVALYDGQYIDAYVNGERCTHTNVGLYNISSNSNNIQIGTRGIKYFNGSIDEVRIYNRALSASEIAVMYNTSLRTKAMPVILNQTASVGNVINRTRINYTGQDAINNASIYARQNGTTAWSLIQANATSNTWYNTPNFNSLDFGIEFNGNGSNTVFLTSLEWDEWTNYIPPTPINISSTKGSNWINTTWQAGTGNITNSYNVSVNSVWTNGSANTSINSTLSSGVWQNVSVYAFNSSGAGTLNQIAISLNTRNNNFSFSFINKSVSETQIYQSSQSTRIRVDVNDSDGYIKNVSVGITFNSVQTNYTMSGGNDTWIYDFKSGVPGVYSVSNFYATDNESGINSSTSTLQFIVVPVISGGSSAPAPIVTPTPIVTIPISTITDIPKYKVQQILKEEGQIQSLKDFLFGIGTEFSVLPREMQWVMYLVMFIVLVMFVKDEKKGRY